MLHVEFTGQRLSQSVDGSWVASVGEGYVLREELDIATVRTIQPKDVIGHDGDIDRWIKGEVWITVVVVELFDRLCPE